MSFLQTVFNWLPKLRAPDNSLADAKCDANGNLQVAIAANTSATTAFVDPAGGVPVTSGRVVSSVSKKLWRVWGTNEGASERWLMIFNSGTALPLTPGTEPVEAFRVPAGGFFSEDYPRARTMSSGITWVVSSTPNTLTLDAAATFRVNFEVE